MLICPGQTTNNLPPSPLTKNSKFYLLLTRPKNRRFLTKNARFLAEKSAKQLLTASLLKRAKEMFALLNYAQKQRYHVWNASSTDTDSTLST